MVSGLLTIAALAGAQGNAEATNAVSDRAAKNVKVIGLDLKTVELGSNGFEVVR